MDKNLLQYKNLDYTRPGWYEDAFVCCILQDVSRCVDIIRRRKARIRLSFKFVSDTFVTRAEAKQHADF